MVGGWATSCCSVAGGAMRLLHALHGQEEERNPAAAPAPVTNCGAAPGEQPSAKNWGARKAQRQGCNRGSIEPPPVRLDSHLVFIISMDIARSHALLGLTCPKAAPGSG